MPRPLSNLRERFCLEYVKGGCKDATKAHADAGYCPNMSHKIRKEKACRLLKDERIQARIAELRRPAADAAGVTLTGHLEQLADLRDEAKKKEQYSAAIQAEISRGKCAGLYLERKQVQLDATVLAAMSAEELEALANQLDGITDSVH